MSSDEKDGSSLAEAVVAALAQHSPPEEPTTHDRPSDPVTTVEPTTIDPPPAGASTPKGISVRYYGRTDVGLVREHNEDNFVVVNLARGVRGTSPDQPLDAPLEAKGFVFAVCDGMGGAAAGEVASQMAVDTVHELMVAGAETTDRDAFARRLVRSIEEAGARIFGAAKVDRNRRGMGTTSTVAGLIDQTLFVGQVGDSRAYVLRGDQFALVTKDQSLVNQLIDAGQLTEEQAEVFEYSNIILQALGTTEEVDVDLTFLELRRGDRLMMCSDGLSGLVHADMMKDVLSTTPDPVEASQRLIAMANAGGGHDNITVVIVDFDGLDLKAPSAEARVAYYKYPLPPSSDEPSAGASRPSSIKTPHAKPGADVKADSSSSRIWLVALVVFLLVALLAALALSFDGGGEAETHRQQIRESEPVPVSAGTAREPRRVIREEAHLRFRGDEFAGATLVVDGTPRGVLEPSGMVVEVAPGHHEIRVDRAGETVAVGEVDIELGHTEFVPLAAVPPPEGVLAPLPVDEPPPAGDPGPRPNFRRRDGDQSHEPPAP